MPDADRAAAHLLAELDAHRVFEPFPGDLKPGTIEDAYAIQDRLYALRLRREGAIGGYKLAYTTPVMQERSGLTEPAIGRVFASTLYESPATLSAAAHVGLGLECEIAVRLGADLPGAGAPYDVEGVTPAVASVMAAIEVIDARAPADMADRDRALMGVAANVWNAGVVTGPPVSAWRGLDLAAVRGTVDVNGERLGEGFGRDVMGHPLAPLAWLANALAARGERLEAGMVVITGSLVAPKFLSPGDEAVVTVTDLGEAVLRVTA